MQYPRQDRRRPESHQPDDGDGNEGGEQLTQCPERARPRREFLDVVDDLAEVERGLRVRRQEIVDVQWKARSIVLLAAFQREETRSEELDGEAKISAVGAGGGVAIGIVWNAELRPFLRDQPVELVHELTELWMAVLHRR
jgi:hypothetical protein